MPADSRGAPATAGGWPPSSRAPAGPLIVGRDTIELLLPPAEACSVIGEALGAGAKPHIDRVSVPFGAGELLVMPAYDEDLAGVKVLTLTPEMGAQGVYVLFDARTLSPLAILDGSALTELRTAAVSAWATDALAPLEASTLLLFGSSAQARSHLVALAGVRPLHELLLVARDDQRAETLLCLGRDLGLRCQRACPDDVARADIVCCCTSSPVPLFDGDLLRPGTHVVAMGSHHPDRREVDTSTVRRSRVVVESRPNAMSGAGDLVIAMQEGGFSPGQVAADLFELAQRPLLPDQSRDLTLFKSVGAAFEDLAIARAVFAHLRDEPGERY